MNGLIYWCINDILLPFAGLNHNLDSLECSGFSGNADAKLLKIRQLAMISQYFFVILPPNKNNK